MMSRAEENTCAVPAAGDANVKRLPTGDKPLPIGTAWR